MEVVNSAPFQMRKRDVRTCGDEIGGNDRYGELKP
jgi:hypothetical protein